jgi:hypothetical protein
MPITTAFMRKSIFMAAQTAKTAPGSGGARRLNQVSEFPEESDFA